MKVDESAKYFSNFKASLTIFMKLTFMYILYTAHIHKCNKT